MSHHNPSSEFCRFGEDRPLQHHGWWLFTDLKTQIWKRTRFSIFIVSHKTRWSGAQPIVLTFVTFSTECFPKERQVRAFLTILMTFLPCHQFFQHCKAWIPILASSRCELWRSWDVAGSRVGKQLAAAAPTSPRNPGEAVIQLRLGRLKVLLLGAIPEKLSLQSLCRQITDFQCYFREHPLTMQ